MFWPDGLGPGSLAAVGVYHHGHLTAYLSGVSKMRQTARGRIILPLLAVPLMALALAGPAAAAPAGTAPSNVPASAAWAARQIPTILPKDSGMLTDTIVAMTSAGIGGKALAAAADVIAASGTQYIGTTEQAPDKAGAIAKVAVGLQIAGREPKLGDRDLLADLNKLANADGSYGAAGADNHAGHLYIVTAFARAKDTSAVNTAVKYYESRQCSDGRYPWQAPDEKSCAGPAVDSTGFAVVGLLSGGVPATDPRVDKAIGYLLGEQQSDGSFTGFSGDPDLASTGMAGWALRLTGKTAQADKALSFVTSHTVTCAEVAAGKFTVDNLGAVPATTAEFSSGTMSPGSHFTTTQGILAAASKLPTELSGAGLAEAAAPNCPASAASPSPSASDSGTVPSSASADQSASASTATDASASPLPTTTAAEPAAAKESNPWPWIAIGGAVVLIGAVLAWMFMRQRSGKRS